MKEMSFEASQLVNAGREAFSPTEADRARLLAALTGAATLSAGVAAAVGGQRWFSGFFGAAQAARVLAVALPVAAASGYWLHTRAPAAAVAVQAPAHAHRPPPAAVPEPASVTPVEAALAGTALGEPLEPSAPAASSAPERSSPGVGEPSKSGKEISQEVALLSKAQAALSRGRPQEALQAIAEHAQRFPRGVLTEERAATRARTLCALGRTQEAAAELKRIEKLSPTSAYLARARESCGF